MSGYIDDLYPDESAWRSLDRGERIVPGEFNTPAEALAAIQTEMRRRLRFVPK
jgi:hypothetical protein